MAKTSTKSGTPKDKATKTTAAKSDTAKKTSTTKTAAKKAPAKASSAPKKAATKKSTADPAAELAKQCQQAATKLEKMEDDKYAEIQGKLEWCIGSYNYDKNPAGLAEYGKQALDHLKQAREEKPRKISQKVIDDLEKAVSNF
ncbi:MAG: hypothetical protein WA960_09925 [Tunicatimonas sp.]